MKLDIQNSKHRTEPILSMNQKKMVSDELNIGNDSFNILKFPKNDYMSQ